MLNLLKCMQNLALDQDVSEIARNSTLVNVTANVNFANFVKKATCSMNTAA